MKTRIKSVLEFMKKRVLNIALLGLSTLFIFLYGLNLESTKCQDCANSLSKMAKKYETSPIVAIYDEKETTARMFSNHYYGFELFHSGHNVFAGYNSDKTKKSSLTYNGDEIENPHFNNLTLITTRGLSVEINKEGKYKNSYYDFDLMFPSIGKGDGYSNSCFVTVTQANHLLTLSNKQTYEDLIGMKLTFVCDDRTPLELTIFNIILEQGEEYERFTKNIGFFFVANDWEFLRKPFLEMYYFMDKYTFENYHYLSMIKNAYNSENIDGRLINLKSDPKEIQNNDSKLNIFLKNQKQYGFINVFFLISSILCLSLTIFFVVNKLGDFGKKDCFMYLCLPPIIYLIFKLVYASTKSVKLFSYYSLVGLFVLEIVLFVALWVLYFSHKRRANEII